MLITAAFSHHNIEHVNKISIDQMHSYSSYLISINDYTLSCMCSTIVY